ncbi:hypothetical protein DN730_10445 [Marinomonas piezotolerans]|uniref:BioF2-like acetyltransferase domain-containing protein n=1 Tax=Marinomonas piezotolerans TaxID=2213058 RepID=A0A370U8E6_9GAMM|nr:DegT/DnrJ/EryC1/StrS family aminotransferase [Marinomonas piezotolerans]RDL44047.1 hypothetical protein DN730_10445 [Marinomonas piezotolerans]
MKFFLKPKFSILDAFAHPVKHSHFDRLFGASAQSPFWYSRSSISLLQVAIWKYKIVGSKPTVWVPSYICQDALENLRIFGCEIEYYDAGFDLKYSGVAKQLKEVKSDDLVVYVHYFGRNEAIGLAAIANLVKKSGAWLIEDAAHCLTQQGNVGRYGDFALYSPYKRFNIPNGGLLVAGESIMSTLVDNSFIGSRDFMYSTFRSDLAVLGIKVGKSFGCISNIKWFAKEFVRSIIGSRRYSYLSHSSSELLLRDNTPKFVDSPEVSYLSPFLLKLYLGSIESRTNKHRLINYAYEKLIDVIRKIYNFDVEIFWSDSSYLFEIRVLSSADSLKLSELLYGFGLPVIRWPNLPKELEYIESSAYSVYERSIFLPVNESISLSSIYRIVSSIVTNDLSSKVDSYISSLPSSFVQSNSYMNARLSLTAGELVTLDDVSSKTGVVGIGRRIKKLGASINLFSFGPSLSGNFAELSNDLEHFGCKYGFWFKLRALVIHPKLVLSPDSLFLFWYSGFRKLPIRSWRSSVIDLKLSDDSIRANLNKKWRNQLVKSESFDLDVSFSNEVEHILEIARLNEEYLKSIDASGTNSKFIDNLISECSSSRSDLDLVCLRACHEGDLIGGVILAISPEESTYFVGWSNDKGRELYVMQRLLWNSIVYAKNTCSCEFFDMGGIDVLNTPGVAKFKIGLNGTPYTTAGTYIYVPRCFRALVDFLFF